MKFYYALSASFLFAPTHAAGDALASSSLLSFSSAVDTKRIKRNLRHIESAKNENINRFLAIEMDSMSMASNGRHEADASFMGGKGGASKSSKSTCLIDIRDEFARIDNSIIQVMGLQELQPGFEDPTISELFFEDCLSEDSLLTTCLTKCDNDPQCGAATFSILGEELPRCFMYRVDPELGGAYLLQFPTDSFYGPATTFIKKSGSQPPAFEDVQCDIDSGGEAIFLAVGCTAGKPGIPKEICDKLLTDDWIKFVAPAVDCLLGSGVESAVEGCLECTNQPAPGFNNTDICPTSSGDITTIFRDPSKCGSECVLSCEDKLNTALLCVTGAQAVEGENKVQRGLINGPSFTCPTLDM